MRQPYLKCVLGIIERLAHVVLWYCKTTITMRQHISRDIKWLVLRLATVRGYKYKKIHEISGVSERTTKHICALYWQTGDVVKKRTIDGGPRLLNGFHISDIGKSVTFATNSCIVNARGSFSRVVLNNNLTCCCQSCKISLRVLVEYELHP
jgi:hypothetical protein